MSELKKLTYSIESCNHCGQCKWLLPSRMHGWDFAAICPIHDYYHFDAYSGQGMLNIAAGLLNGSLSISEELTRMLHTCTACGACDINCKNVRDMEVLDTIYELRRESAEAGLLPDSVKETAERLEKNHHRFRLAREEHLSFLPDGFVGDTNCDTLLFAGCSADQHPETLTAAIRILQAGGVKFRLLREEEWCCGSFLWRSGLYEQAGKLVQRNVQLFERLGIRRVITTCAECFGAFRNGYPRFAKPGFETLHISQVAAQLLEEGRLRLKAGEDLTVTYHDPCMLGRNSEAYVPWEGEIQSYGLHVPEKTWRRGEFGVYEAPRAVLKAIPGVKLVEMVRSREEAWCCGNAASEIDPDFAARTAEERLREAAFTGADMLVSACPFCRDSMEETERENLRYRDLTELLAERLEDET